MANERAKTVVACIVTAVLCVGCGGRAEDPPAEPCRAEKCGTTTTARLAPDAPLEGTTGGSRGLVLDEEPSGSGHVVVIYGDSLTVAAAPELRERLGSEALLISAGRGEGFGGGPWTEAFDRPDGLMVDRARSHATLEPSVVVLALGTNDAWRSNLGLDDALQGLAAMTDSLRGACIVGVTIAPRSPAEHYDEAEATAINDAVRAVSDQVVEWSTFGEHVSSDGIHLDDEGSTAMAAGMVDAVRRCLG